MSSLQKIFGSATFDSTTTSGHMSTVRESPPKFSVIVISGALAIYATSSAEPNQVWEDQVPGNKATAAGMVSQAHSKAMDNLETTRRAITELRRISGLTWEQLGKLFDVSRRSVHFWASGKPLNTQNEQRLMQILDVIRAADRGDARSNRAALFKVKNGVTAFSLLREWRLKEAREILGVGPGRPEPALAELNAAAKAAHEPSPPEELVEAQHDRVHRDSGRARTARTTRGKRRGTS